jgi:L-aspartate oxidase
MMNVKLTSHKNSIHSDILILGTGLAGMRAAMAALAEAPGSKVTLVSATNGPSGSSFANMNNALGVQVHETDTEREAFANRALHIASPGWVDVNLVRILAMESRDRFQDMVALGLRFKRQENGQCLRFPACFAPDLDHARVFTDLAHAHSCFRHRVDTLGASFLKGWRVREIMLDHDNEDIRASGAILENPAGEEAIVRARVVIVALGGPAGKYRYNMAPAGNTGDAWDALTSAGVVMVNTEYVQFMWATVPDRRFVHVGRLACAEAGVWERGENLNHGEHGGHGGRKTGGINRTMPEDLFQYAAQRATHCPMAYGMDDARIDDFLLACQDPDGVVHAFLPDMGWFRMAPMAHAGNGGAIIDDHGRTNIPGLYCVGECAAGMHGANRIGGTMVLATQVFGRRAGIAAAQEAARR